MRQIIKRKGWAWVCGGSLLFSAGCASFPKYDVGRFPPPSKVSSPTKPLSVLIVTRLALSRPMSSGDKKSAADIFRGIVQEETSNIASNFKDYAIAPAKLSDASLQITFELSETYHPVKEALAVFAFLLTYMIMPVSVTDEFTLTATIQDQTGRVLKKTVLHDRLKTWIEFFLIFAQKPPIDGIRAVISNLIRAFYAQIDWSALST